MSIETSNKIVIALGNRYRGDDGVGHTVVEELVRRGAPCRVVTNQDDSMALINAWQSASLAIIVDALNQAFNVNLFADSFAHVRGITGLCGLN